MYTREEASRMRQEFWTSFGRYMRPIPSSAGAKINWVNYHTGVRHVHFRMSADARSAIIAISLEHPDHGIRQLFFDQFLEMKTMLHVMLEEEWRWERESFVEGKNVSRIYTELHGASVFNRDQWPELISFFKPRLIRLDAFWENARQIVETLH